MSFGNVKAAMPSPELVASPSTAPPTVVLRADELSKSYRIYRRPIDRLKEALDPRKRTYHEEFPALAPATLEVRRGEFLGVIGRNGSGKSTLLRLLCGVLSPTTGRVSVTGRRFSILEVGAGLDRERTGRENLDLGIKLQGVAPREVERRVAEAAAFADLGAFLDRPVRTYSSGMMLRLGFSLAVTVEPDVILIDEALAVGDLAFQMKCVRRIREFQRQGTAIVLVSHDLAQVASLCNRVLVLDRSRIQGIGDPRAMVDLYKRILAGALAPIDGASGKLVALPAYAGRLVDRFPRHSECQDYGTGDAVIADYGFRDGDGVPALVTRDDDEIEVLVSVRAARRVAQPIIAFGIKDFAGHDIAGTNTLYADVPVPALDPGTVVNVRFRQQFTFKPGRYTFSCSCNELREEGLIVHHRLFDAFVFEHVSTRRFVGWVDLQSRVSAEVLAPDEAESPQ